jgi:acyl-CoA thioesterase I
MLFGDNELILFQGDSITDCGRPREDEDWHLGLGYAAFIGARLGQLYPKLNLRFLNRGISGDTVPLLQARWQAECLDVKADWVSILIGVNDACSAAQTVAEGNQPVDYEAGYRDILTQTRDSGAKLIIIEPFLLDTQHEYDDVAATEAIRAQIDPIIASARKLAAEFEAVYVPMDGIYADACKDGVAAGYWAPDAIHPSQPGHSLMAEAWLAAVGAV